MRAADLFVCCWLLGGARAAVDEHLFVAEYCAARHFRSVTVIASARDDPLAFLPLLRHLNDRGIRLAVQTDVAGRFGFSAFALHLVLHHVEVVNRIFVAGSSFGAEITASGKHWLIVLKNEDQAMKNALANATFGINSDVIAAVSFREAIELQEIYRTGGEAGTNVITNSLGTWSGGGKLDLFGFKTPKMRRRQNLRGHRIRLSSVNINPQYTVVTKNENNKLELSGGYVGNIINFLKSQLNFTYEVKVLDGYAYGLFFPENKTWTGLMGDLQKGDADMTGCEISIAENRVEFAEFSLPIQMIGRRIHYKRPDRQFNWDTFLKPFSSNIWLTLLLTLPLAAFVTYCLNKLSPSKGEDHEDKGSITYGSDFFGVISALALQGWSGVFGGLSRRSFILTVFVCYMIVSLSYSAKMVAMRTVEKPQLPINNLADVLDHTDWDFGFIGKALERGIFEFSAPETLLGMIWRKRILPKMGKSLVGDSMEGLVKAFSGKYVFMCNPFHCRKLLQTDFGPEKSCQMQVLPEDYFLGALTLGFKRNSTIRELIDQKLMIMKESGILDIELQHAMPQPIVCENDQFSKINILDVAPAIILLAFGMCVSLLVLAIEYLWHSRSIKLLGKSNFKVAKPKVRKVAALKDIYPNLYIPAKYISKLEKIKLKLKAQV